MIRWEYHIETVYEDHPKGIYYPLNELGRDGWELVSVTRRTIPGRYVCFFKRPYKMKHEPTDGTRFKLTDEELDQIKIGGTD